MLAQVFFNKDQGKSVDNSSCQLALQNPKGNYRKKIT